MRKAFLLGTLCTLCILAPQAAHAKLWDSVTSWFGSLGKKYEKTIDRQYTIPQGGSLIIKNITGSIRVETEWSEKTVVVSAKKIAKTEDALNCIDIVQEDPADSRNVIVQTVQRDPNAAVTVEYTLIVPQHLPLTLETKTGNIIVKDINGMLNARTIRGNIELYNIKGSINATSELQGNIDIYQADGPIHANTHYGAITMYETNNAVIAKTQSGRIKVYVQDLPKNKELWLQSRVGSITLYLPTTVHADIRAKTEMGTVKSQHPITFREFTTTLDTDAWKLFKKEIKGIVGTNPDTRIRLYSKDSSIDIKLPEED